MTGATPAQLAFDKGHRVLGLRLVDASQSHKNEDKCAKNKWFKKISNLQLAPIIWILIFGLLIIFIDKVRMEVVKLRHSLCPLVNHIEYVPAMIDL